MEVELVRMQVEYCDDGRFQSYGLTSWPRISKMFFDNLPKMVKNASIDWATHLELNWEYVTILSEKTKELLWCTP
jgi:hypothetical protein